MTTIPVQDLDRDDAFLAMVDFKWLMAGHGWWVDLSRMKRDGRYAVECARRGLSCESPLLQQHSLALMGLVTSGAQERVAR